MRVASASTKDDITLDVKATLFNLVEEVFTYTIHDCRLDMFLFRKIDALTKNKECRRFGNFQIETYAEDKLIKAE